MIQQCVNYYKFFNICLWFSTDKKMKSKFWFLLEKNLTLASDILVAYGTRLDLNLAITWCRVGLLRLWFMVKFCPLGCWTVFAICRPRVHCSRRCFYFTAKKTKLTFKNHSLFIGNIILPFIIFGVQLIYLTTLLSVNWF